MTSHVHSLNNSRSHQKYSFPKEQRFQYSKPTTDVYYMPQTDKNKRSALIGCGQRSLTSVSDKYLINAPHAYSIPSSINIKKGVSFTSGRHQIGGPLQSVKYKKQFPSPLNYQLGSSLQKKGAQFGLKLKDFSQKYFQSVKIVLKKVPGPGAYSVPSTVDGLDGNGKKIFESRFSSGGSYKIGNLHQSQILHRDKIQKFQIPGPGQYNVQKYGLSNPESVLQKHSSVKFAKQKRSQLQKRGAQRQPGPGQQQKYLKYIQNLIERNQFCLYNFHKMQNQILYKLECFSDHQIGLAQIIELQQQLLSIRRKFNKENTLKRKKFFNLNLIQLLRLANSRVIQVCKIQETDPSLLNCQLRSSPQKKCWI